MVGYFSDTEEERERDRVAIGNVRALELEERKSGIGWKFAGQGRQKSEKSYLSNGSLKN